MLLGIVRSTSIPNNIHITLVMLAHAFLAIICAESQKTTGVEASAPPLPSSVTVVDASPPPPAGLPLISSPSLPTPPAFASSPLQAHSATPLASPKALSILPQIEVSSPLHMSPMISAKEPPPLLSVREVTSLASSKVPSLPSPIEVPPSLFATHISPLVPAPPASFSPAPLTVPEVRHLLGSLIWPASTNTKLVLAWSWWRRRHRGMASECHSKQRLKAG
jgi:hypothetical protein